MSDELQKPPVLDIEGLLRPIDGDNPSGENLRYSGIYDEISNARRADKVASQGEWQTELKVADFRQVIEIAVPALEQRSKDLQIAVWLTEALIEEHGFVGLRDGVRLLSGLESTFWDTLYPEIDEGDMEGRANAVSWLDIQGGISVTKVPITAGSGHSFIDWEDSKRFDIPENYESLDSDSRERFQELKHQAETERRTTGDMWRKAKAQTPRQFYEELDVLLDECWAAVRELDRVNEEKYDARQMPGLSNLQKSLEKVHAQVKKLLEEKRLEEPDEAGAEEYGESGAETASGGSFNGGGGGSVQGRADALRRLAEIAAFFQKTEPHSPVAYLVQRAVKWGNMPLDSWLQDVIKDENVLFQLRQTLGLDTVDGSSGGAAAEPAEGW